MRPLLLIGCRQQDWTVPLSNDRQDQRDTKQHKTQAREVVGLEVVGLEVVDLSAGKVAV